MLPINRSKLTSKKPNFFLLFLSQLFLLNIPVSIGFYMLAINFGLGQDYYTFIIAVISALVSISLYNSLYRDAVIYLENTKTTNN